jgi:hypothetical protein
MAKRRRKTNMSQAIRKYLDKKPSATPKEIQAALAAKGLKVSYSLISQVKYKSPSAAKRSKSSLGRVRLAHGRQGDRRQARRRGAGQGGARYAGAAAIGEFALRQ